MADRIEAAVARSRREARSAALLVIDIDSFKRVNNTLGHAAGDELLALVANRLRSLGQSHVEVGRHAGDEFLLLVDDLPHDPARREAGHRGDRPRGCWRRCKSRSPWSGARSRSAFRSARASSRSTPRATTSSSTTPTRRCILAKRRGRGQLAMFDQPENHSILELESTLRTRRALSKGELELFYQPVVDIADDHRLCALEALLRWRDPDRGLLLPGGVSPVRRADLAGGRDRRVGVHRDLPPDRRVGQPWVQAEGQLQHPRAPAPAGGLRRSSWSRPRSDTTRT